MYRNLNEIFLGNIVDKSKEEIEGILKIVEEDALRIFLPDDIEKLIENVTRYIHLSDNVVNSIRSDITKLSDILIRYDDISRRTIKEADKIFKSKAFKDYLSLVNRAQKDLKDSIKNLNIEKNVTFLRNQVKQASDVVEKNISMLPNINEGDYRVIDTTKLHKYVNANMEDIVSIDVNFKNNGIDIDIRYLDVHTELEIYDIIIEMLKTDRDNKRRLLNGREPF